MTEDIDWLDEKEKWCKLTSLGLVESFREIDGVITQERRYYISSLSMEMKRFAKAVRQHWPSRTGFIGFLM